MWLWLCRFVVLKKAVGRNVNIELIKRIWIHIYSLRNSLTNTTVNLDIFASIYFCEFKQKVYRFIFVLFIFSSPEPKARVSYCHSAPSVVRPSVRPSSSVRPSVRRKLFTFSTSSLKSLNGIQQNLTGSKISTPSTKFVFFGPIGKTRWRPWPLIGWAFFDFSSETAEQNSTKLDRKQDLNALYQVCVFRAD